MSTFAAFAASNEIQPRAEITPQRAVLRELIHYHLLAHPPGYTPRRRPSPDPFDGDRAAKQLPFADLCRVSIRVHPGNQSVVVQACYVRSSALAAWASRASEGLINTG